MFLDVQQPRVSLIFDSDLGVLLSVELGDGLLSIFCVLETDEAHLSVLTFLHREREDLSVRLKTLLDIGLGAGGSEVLDEEVVCDSDRVAFPVLLDCEDTAFPLDLLHLEEFGRDLNIAVADEGVAG